MPPYDIASTIKFSDVCDILDRVKKSKIASKEKYIRRYYESFLKHREQFRREHNITSEEETGESSFYCVLRCLIPGADMVREPYNLQITSLGKVYIKVLQLPADSGEVQRLNARSNSGIRGDYADIVYAVLKPRVQHDPSNLTLKDVHELLDTIAADDRRNTEKVLTALVEKASCTEQKWFIRLLLKSMHLEIGAKRVLNILHPQARELYERCSNLKRVCCLLADCKLTVETKPSSETVSASVVSQLNLNAAIVPFQHVRPMLCEIFPGDISPLMASDLLYVETKMDGERFQLHFADGNFKYISRNGKDYTSSFGDGYTSGNLTPRLENIMPIGISSIIIDGEMMVWDEQLRKFHDKGTNTDVKHLSSDGEGTWRPCFVAYDLLYLDGTDLLDMPYVQRAFKLKCLLTEREGVLHVMKPTKVTSMDEFKNLFQKALDENQEGVVIKKQNSIYKPGVRNGGGWYKIKADYIEGLTQEFDVIIMGGFYNRKRTFIESFLLGVLNIKHNGSIEVYSVGKVSNITRQRSVFNDILRPHWHAINAEPAPLWYKYADVAEGRPDLWIEPKNSIIIQVRAADLTNSTAFALPKCLHFPRIVRYRQDKDWQECLTLKEFQELYQFSGRNLKKINKRELTDSDITTSRKRHKLTLVDKRNLGMLSYEKKLKPEEIERVSDILAGYEVCVLSGCLKEGITPEDLKAMVVSHGGEVLENPIYSNPQCISVAGDLTYRVERMCKVGRSDIVNIYWLIKSCETGKVQKLRPRDMVCTTDAINKVFKTEYDEYGDSYEEFVNMNELGDILDDITDEQLSAFECSNEALEKLKSQMKLDNFFSSRFPNGYFYGSSLRSGLSQAIYEWHGGKYFKFKEKNVDLSKICYVFIDLDDLDEVEFKIWLKDTFGTFLKNLQVVNIEWIIHSHKAERKLDVFEYTWLHF